MHCVIADIAAVFSSLLATCVAYNTGYGGSYPAFPALPWITIPQRWIGNPLYLPNPPIYASYQSSEIVAPYQNYKWEYFYDHGTTTAAPTAVPAPGASPAAAGDAAPAEKKGPEGKRCQAATAANHSGGKDGTCIPQNVVATCPSGAASNGAPCAFFEVCCVDRADGAKILAAKAALASKLNNNALNPAPVTAGNLTMP